NGIEDLATRGDLLERSIQLRLPSIPEHARRPESEFWFKFDAALPKLLGAVFDRVAAALKELPRVKLDRLPRMADFALFGIAAEVGAGGTGEVFRRAYGENQAGAHELVLEESPLVPALRRLMADRDSWEGSPTELLGELNRLTGYATGKAPDGW